jgi:hypothetical protein
MQFDFGGVTQFEVVGSDEHFQATFHYLDSHESVELVGVDAGGEELLVGGGFFIGF